MTYHGAVYDAGRDFAAIQSEGRLVLLKFALEGKWSTACIDVRMEASQARELARHLKAASETALTPHQREGET